MVGERIRHARIYHGWTQTDFAHLIGKSQSAVFQMEKTGQVAPETLATIAKVTEFAPWWFELGPLPDLPTGSLRYRKLASATKKDDEQLRAHVRHTLEVLERLSKNAEMPPVRLRPVGMDRSVITADDIESMASEVRELFGIGPVDPIPSVTRAMERAGIAVVGSGQAIVNHSAVSYWPDLPVGRPIVCFSRGYSGDHQRFSLAHEVGHLRLHSYRNVSGKEAESEAHRFAGALLIPREAMFDEMTGPVTLRTLAYVKARWGISVGALIRRCLDLQIINHERRVSLEKQLHARGWKREEPVHVPVEEPLLLPKLIRATYGTASLGQLSSALGLPAMANRDLVA